MDRSWQELAACRDSDVELFYSVDDADITTALAVCSRCSVRRQCLGHALSVGEMFGVWGGTSEAQRREARRAGQKLTAA